MLGLYRNVYSPLAEDVNAPLGRKVEPWPGALKPV
jgi:hypothetical protein